MHHVGGSFDWYPATPPKGTGVHEYVAYMGSPPCSENGSCDGCASPVGIAVCSVKIDPEDCSVVDVDGELGGTVSTVQNNSTPRQHMEISEYVLLVLGAVLDFGIWQ